MEDHWEVGKRIRGSVWDEKGQREGLGMGCSSGNGVRTAAVRTRGGPRISKMGIKNIEKQHF